MDEYEQHVLDTLREYSNCYLIDSVSGLRKMTIKGKSKEWDFTTIRVLIISV